VTKEKYKDTHCYKGKHEPQEYGIYVVAGPAGGEYKFTVTGMEEVRKAIVGAWDWEVTRLSDGKVINI